MTITNLIIYVIRSVNIIVIFNWFRHHINFTFVSIILLHNFAVLDSNLVFYIMKEATEIIRQPLYLGKYDNTPSQYMLVYRYIKPYNLIPLFFD